MPKTQRKTHSFTITVSAPNFLTRRDVAREVRTLINDQSNYLSGKYVGQGLAADWIPLDTDAIRARSVS